VWRGREISQVLKARIHLYPLKILISSFFLPFPLLVLHQFRITTLSQHNCLISASSLVIPPFQTVWTLQWASLPSVNPSHLISTLSPCFFGSTRLWMQRWRCWLPLISLGAFRHSRNRGQNTLIGLQISGLRVPLTNVIICFIIFLWIAIIPCLQYTSICHILQPQDPPARYTSYFSFPTVTSSCPAPAHGLSPLDLLLISSSFSKTPKANNSGPLAGYCSLPLQPPVKFPSNHVHCSYYMHLSRF